MRRKFIKAATLTIAVTMLGLTSHVAHADTSFPSRPLTIIIGGSAGGSSDVFARAVAHHMEGTLGQPVIVDYKPGAGTNIGTDYVVRAKPDGYTLLINGLPIVANSHLFPNLTFNSATDLVPIVGVAKMTNVITVHPSVPVKTLAELIALARKEPSRFSYGSPGMGTSSHIAGEMLADQTGISLTHVSYRGNAQAIADLIGGTVQLGFVNTPVAAPFLKEGRLKALAVTSAHRSPMLPDVPTVAEALNMPGYDFNGWFGLFAPKGTPPAIVQRIQSAANKALAEEKVKLAFEGVGAEPMGGSTDDFVKFVETERTRVSALLKKP